ncbi:hypothetical protein BpHYR1_052126 [Brachionus plicatilis]|uniref:G-protein coupled receptors family 1 profile domain-containing protein n=1 Tax=Brachionus plicatilis TaxID=10195 RepID=A0A3M7RXH0_BRAPC|nr:hypothetical protein BpHYR1_052126 [Brachionus plicatilis]
MEHLKDSLIYMNLFIISVISIERYFAVCKPQYYKTLESNINKIIWMVYIFFFCFSASNYLTDIKLDSNCAPDKEISSDQKESKFSFKKLLNYLNVILSTFFFIATAIISSSFYCKITFHRSNASFNLNNHLITNKNIKNSQEPVDSTNSLQKNQSNASVQTDFNSKFDKEIKKKKILRQRSSSTKVLTKISILLSAIIWLSTLPFVLIVIGILPFLKFLMFSAHLFI